MADGAEPSTWFLSKSVGGAWIFPALPADTVNQYVDFRHELNCTDRALPTVLRISADTDFEVWLNGQSIGHGQFSNYPDRKTYERFDLGGALQSGPNILALTVYYNGRNSSVYCRGEAGLVFEVRQGDCLLAASGPGTEWRMNPCYHSGPIAIVSHQLSYTFGYDARNPAVPLAAANPSMGWRPIGSGEVQVSDARMVLPPRPVARMTDGGLTDSRLHACGVFSRDLRGGVECLDGCHLVDGTVESPAQLMQRDHLRALPTRSLLHVPGGVRLCARPDGLKPDAALCEGYSGLYVVLDLGQEEVGLLTLDIEAPDGTVVDIGYGEHLDDLRVRTQIGGRNFASRLICREGRQIFVHPFLRWAGRYLQLQIQSARFTLYRCDLARCPYPVSPGGVLALRRERPQRILDTCRRTLMLCMHDHYEDTPWREQALYANDSRTQALCGYYAFGETRFPSASLSLLGHGLRTDGFLALTAPAKPPLTIPSFSLVWMLAIRDHYLFSGNPDLARTWLPQILSMLQAFLAERREGLWPLRQAAGIWHFYDWAEGLSGYVPEDFSSGLVSDAPLNCFLILALDAVREMVKWLAVCAGERPVADGAEKWLTAAIDSLREHVTAEFWDPQEGAFVTTREKRQLSELVQGLAVLAGVGDEAIREQVLERMVRPDAGLTRASLSQSLYVFEALMSQKKRYGAHVVARIESVWGPMLDAGATTFWETEKGASDFHDAGSLCHGWSAVPLYIYFAEVLGVRPLTPGFQTFRADPMPTLLSSAGGEVVVPGGTIRLSMQPGADPGSWQVEAPAMNRMVK